MALVLIMEDEPAISIILKIALTGAGFDVDTTPDGLTGIKRLEEGPLPDIVLTDLNMPNLNGKQVVNFMRAHAKFKNIPILIITASLPNDVNFPPQDSYQGLIIKPFDLDEVIQTVKELTSL